MKTRKRTSISEVRQQIRAVYEKDIELLIMKLSLQKRIEEGKISCVSCSQPITYLNVGIIYKKNGLLQIACNKPQCFSSSTQELKK